VKYMLANGTKVSLSKDKRGKTVSIANIVRNRIEIGNFQERKRYGAVAELLESFERNPNETKVKLRFQLGFAGTKSIYFRLI